MRSPTLDITSAQVASDVPAPAAGARERAVSDPARALPLLSSARVFREWPRPTLETIAALAQFRQMSRRGTLSRPGAATEQLLVVVRGAVEVGAFSAAGKKIIVHTGGPGYVYGWLALTNQPRLPQYLDVSGASELLIVPGAAVRAALTADPALWQSVAFEIAHRYRKALAGITDQLTAPLDKRLALSLYALVRSGSYEIAEQGAHTLRVSQADLAATLGVTRQSTNRELQALAKSGVVSLDYGRITVNDPAELRRRIEDLTSLLPGASAPGPAKA